MLVSGMDHSLREQDGTWIVELRGDVDLSSSPDAREALLDAVGRGGAVLVDLSGVGYMDSSGVASLVEALQQSKQANVKFALAAVQERALRVLKLARLDRVFTIHEQLADGL
jgi:anti-sigma B factor antagonist